MTYIRALQLIGRQYLYRLVALKSSPLPYTTGGIPRGPCLKIKSMKFLSVFAITFLLARVTAATVNVDADKDIALAMLRHMGLDSSDIKNPDVEYNVDDNQSTDPIDVDHRGVELEENESKISAVADNRGKNLEDNASLEADLNSSDPADDEGSESPDTIAERSVDDVRSSRSLEVGRKLRSLHFYTGGSFIKSSMTDKYFKATDFAQCTEACIRRSCASFSYRWDGQSYCRISNDNVDSSKLFKWPSYDTYRLMYSSSNGK